MNLNKYREINQEITQLIIKKERLFDMATRTTPHITDMPRGGNRKIDDTYAEMIDIEKQINDQIDNLVMERHRICQSIRKIDDVDVKKALAYRYLTKWTGDHGMTQIGLSYRQIGRRMNVSPKKALTLVRKGQNELHKI